MNIHILSILNVGIANGEQCLEKDAFIDLESSTVWHLRGYLSVKAELQL